MISRKFLATAFLCHIYFIGIAQSPQGFFLDGWQPRTISSPEYNDLPQTTANVTVAVTVDFNDTITKISPYLFGDNANLWTGCMSNNAALMRHIKNRDIGVLRGPGGSISDVYFWNRNVDQRPADIPPTLMGSSEANYPWYGDRPYSWETWTMDVDSLYSIRKKVGATGMNTVNYGYARYGTGTTPVSNAAHVAADWVRYDKGRSKFWEIGNEVFGSWEAGYRINTSLNKDAQPEYINPSLYGQHCNVFIDSMKAAAAKTGYEIKIGVVMAEATSTAGTSWNTSVATQAGSKADFYIIHSYYTPYNENSTPEVILSTPSQIGSYLSYVWGEADKVGKPHLPVALTEYNIWALGSGQQLSNINGLHGVLVIGEAIKAGLGAACRWDLANGYDNGNDHGLFSYNEPGIPNYTPHAPFYHLYYLRRFTGDVLLDYSMKGASGITVIPSAFHSGQVGAALVNTSRTEKCIRLNIKNFRFGSRYYTYTLAGTAGEEFSKKVYVNGSGPVLDAGGPSDYETLKAVSSLIGDEIVIRIPALAVTYVLVEKGTRELAVNEETGIKDTGAQDNILIFPNPSSGSFTISNIPSRIYAAEVKDLTGKTVYILKEGIKPPEYNFSVSLKPGIYFIILTGDNRKITGRFIIK